MNENSTVDSEESIKSRLSLWKIAVAVMIGGIIAFIGFIAFRAIGGAQWDFGIEIDTEVAEINLRPGNETRWQIDGAVICSRDVLTLPDSFRLNNPAEICGSRTWKAWKITEPEQILKLIGDISVIMESSQEGGFAMSIRTGESETLGNLSVTGVVDDLPLGKALNVIWQPETLLSRTFPFSGSTILGRSITWSDSRMLQSGVIAVYTSDESADQRTLVDEAQLMLGDQVRLVESTQEGIWPKGFVHISPQNHAMEVVAFGKADSLKIERYGNSGYDFKPGFLSKLLSDPFITLWGSILATYITLVMTIHPFVNEVAYHSPTNARLIQRIKHWFFKKI